MQRPHGDVPLSLRMAERSTHLRLSVIPSGYMTDGNASSGHTDVHFMHDVHNCFDNDREPFRSAVVITEVNLILGPFFSVNNILFMPNEPKPAKYAA
jgi:hypothetical protein